MTQASLKLTKNDREALRVYRSLVRQREAGTLPSVGGVSADVFRVPRVRLATDIDLSKAAADCKTCDGSGVAETRLFEDETGRAEVPVVCGCVIRGGGIRPDKLDEMAGGTS